MNTQLKNTALPLPFVFPFALLVAPLVLLPASSARAAIEPGSLDSSDLLEPDRQAAVAAHFKQRKPLDFNPIVYADGFAKPDWWQVAKRDEPARVMRHEFAKAGVYTQFPEEIDWNGMVDDDRESMWNVNRFGFLHVLREAHQRGEGEKYLRKGVDLMLDWVAKCPVEDADDQWASWRPLEIGLRLNMWCQFLDYAARQDVLTPGELCVLLSSLRDQADRLNSITGPGRGNHGLMENMGLGVAALSFPELAGASDWLRTSLGNFESDVQTQVYPDGSHEEMSPVYQFTVLCSLVRVAYLARQREVTVPPIVMERMRAMNRYLTFIRKPDGTLPAFNDGDRYDLSRFFELVARWQDQREALWVLTGGKEGDKPDSPHFFAPYSGLVIFRTDFSPDAQSLLLDAGPFGTGHQHHDLLQVEYSAFGEDFLVEPGRYTYARSPIRDWIVGTHAHCTISVDGGHQRTRHHREAYRTQEPIDVHLRTGDDFCYARKLYPYGYDGAENVTHRRSIFFVPGRYAVIYDLVDGDGEHRVDLNWSFPPLEARVVDDRTVLAKGAKASLLMRTAGAEDLETSVVVGRKDPPAGWFSEVYGVVHPAPHVTMTARVALPARFATLLVPMRGDEAKPGLDPAASAIHIDPARDEQVFVTIDDTRWQLSPAGVAKCAE